MDPGPLGQPKSTAAEAPVPAGISAYRAAGFPTPHEKTPYRNVGKPYGNRIPACGLLRGSMLYFCRQSPSCRVIISSRAKQCLVQNCSQRVIFFFFFFNTFKNEIFPLLQFLELFFHQQSKTPAVLCSPPHPLSPASSKVSSLLGSPTPGPPES